jgi:Reverse transcriptase (RNA-dependent DNA polymerase)
MPAKTRLYPLTCSPLYRMPSKRKLSTLLGISISDLGHLSGPDHLYSHFPVKKKDGTSRLVDNPRDQLKRVQRRLADLLGRVIPPDVLFCPVKGRSYVDNAAHHRGGRVVHCLDIKKYFPSTTRRRVYWFFNSVLDCPPDVATILARIACCDDHLATGSPLSPILAYYAHVDVWQKVARLAGVHDCKLSIYIDDVTVSGRHVPTTLLWEIKQAIHGSGLRYHKEKRSVDRSCEVTGVVLRAGRLCVPNRQHKKLRNAKKQKDRKADPESLGTFAGLVGQFHQITNANRAKAEKTTRSTA